MSRWSRRSGGSTPRLSVRSGETKGFFFIYISIFFIFYFDKREMRRNYKILLLGTGESGKSTFMRNLRVVHGSGFSTKERQDAPEVSLSTLWLGRESVSMFSTGDCQQPGHHCVPDSVSDGPSKGEHFELGKQT